MKRSLSCLSSNGRIVHSLQAETLHKGNASITTHFLPLSNVNDENDSNSATPNQDRGTAYTYNDQPDVLNSPSNATTNIGAHTPIKNDPSSSSSRSKVYSVPLPERIVSSLRIDPPLGLLCADHVISNITNHDDLLSRQKQERKSGSVLAVLALYSRTCVWLIELGHGGVGRNLMLEDDYYRGKSGISSSPERRNRERRTMQVLSVEEPFEGYLLGSPVGTGIVTVRSAPSDILAPPGSLAMLTTNGTLVLYHGNEQDDENNTTEPHVTTPLTHIPLVHELNDSSMLADFCFGLDDNDDGSSLGELTVYILINNGDVYAISPVVFDSAAYSRVVMERRVSLLNDMGEKLLRPPSSSSSTPIPPSNGDKLQYAHWRQYRAAKQWMVDCFGNDVSSGQSSKSLMYITSQSFRGRNNRPSASTWPLQLQGPLVHGRTTDSDGNPMPPACALEMISSWRSHPITCMAILRQNSHLDLCVLATPVRSRFAFESDEDADILDEVDVGSGCVVESLVFDQLNHVRDEKKEKGMVSLVVDPIHPSSLIHVADEGGIFSVSFNLMEKLGLSGNTQALGKQGQWNGSLSMVPGGRGGGSSSTTKAWSCMTVGGNVDISGVVVSGDAQLGHILVARLSTGCMEAVNVTAAQYLSQAALQAIATTTKPTTANTISNDTGNIDSIPSFIITAAPLMDQISKGLSSVGKFVGTSTLPKNADAGTVATLLSSKSTLESEVALPLVQLHEETQSRKTLLFNMYKSQIQQLESLKAMTIELKSKLKETTLTKQVVESNATTLSNRSAAVLDASRELLPKLTHAEHEYFTQLKRWDGQCTTWNKSLEDLHMESTKVCDLYGACAGYIKPKVKLHDKQVDMCRSLLAGQGALLEKNKDRLKELEKEVEEMAKVTNVVKILKQ